MAGLKRRERTVVGVAATIFVAVAVLLLVIFPALQQIRLVRQEARGKHVELARLVALVDQRTQIETRYGRVGTAARALEAKLPRDPALPVLVDALGQALLQSRMQLRQISFTQVPVASGNEALPAGMAAVPLQIQVIGDYLRLRAFVGALEQMPRAIVVDRLAITGVQNGVLADLTLRAFYAP